MGTWRTLGVVLGLLVVPAVAAIWTMVAPVLGVIVVVVAFSWTLARILGGDDLPAFPAFLVRWGGAVVVPVLALLGANWWWTFVPHGDQRRPLLGLLVACLIVIGATVVYFRSFWVSTPGTPTGIAGLALALVLVLVVLPVAFGVIAYTKDSHRHVAPVQATSHLDVIVVSRDPAVRPLVGSRLIRGWGVAFHTGRAVGDTVVWSGVEPPPDDPDADRIVLLLPDGRDGQAHDDVHRWARIAEHVGSPELTYAALRADEPGHLDRWKAAFSGRAVLRPEAVGADALVELAEDLAVRSPRAADDRTLAVRHRPFLLFDRHEPYRRPMDVDDLVESGLLRLCPNTPTLQARCDTVQSVQDLRNGGNHVAFDSNEVADLARRGTTTIYVAVRHVTPSAGADVAYLDYWWYLPDNPAKPAHGALCGAGFVIAEKTCFDHQSDWEGVTVVVDGNDPDGAPLEVIYAEHDGSTRYPWPVLEQLWRNDKTKAAAAKAHAVPAVRPLVFIAEGTHAAYPTVCDKKHCAEPKTLVRDNHHDGDRPWEDDADATCDGGTCVTALPMHDQGRRAALWNDYDGRWGTSHCDLRFFCSSSNPPYSPGHQSRFLRPWCAKRSVPALGGKAKTDPKCDESHSDTDSRDAIRLAAAALG